MTLALSRVIDRRRKKLLWHNLLYFETHILRTGIKYICGVSHVFRHTSLTHLVTRSLKTLAFKHYMEDCKIQIKLRINYCGWDFFNLLMEIRPSDALNYRTHLFTQSQSKAFNMREATPRNNKKHHHTNQDFNSPTKIRRKQFPNLSVVYYCCFLCIQDLFISDNCALL